MAGEVLLAVVATLFVVVASFGFGRVALHSAARFLSGLELLASQLLAGFGFMGLALFLLGSYRWNLETVLLVFIPFSMWGFISLMRVRYGLVPRSAFAYYLVPLSLMCICGAAGLSLPVGDIGNDAISYHLLGPSKWALAHRVMPVVDNSHTAFPATVEMLFAAGMLLANERAPGLIDACFAAILLIQIRGFTKIFSSSERPSAIAVTLVSTMPVVMLFASNDFVDIAYACFTLGAIRFALVETPSRLTALFAGVFAGFAIGTKYTGIIFLVLLTLVLFVFDYANRGVSSSVKRGCVVIVTASAISCSWYLRNWLVLHSPIYPIPLGLSRIFESSTFPRSAVVHFDEYIRERGRGFGRGFQWLLALPFTFTFFTAWFHGAGGIGLGPLAYGPFGAAALFRDRRAQFVAAMALLMTVSWFFTQQESRFLIPVIVIAAVFAGIGSPVLLSQQSKFGRLICWSAVVISVCYGAATIVYREGGPLLSLRGRSYEEEWRASGVPYLSAFDFLNKTGGVGRVLVLDFTVPVYYLHRDYIKPVGLYGELSVPSFGPSLTLDQAGALGVTHILDVESKVSGEHFKLKPSSHLTLVFGSQDAHIFKLERITEGPTQ